MVVVRGNIGGGVRQRRWRANLQPFWSMWVADMSWNQSSEITKLELVAWNQSRITGGCVLQQGSEIAKQGFYLGNKKNGHSYIVKMCFEIVPGVSPLVVWGSDGNGMVQRRWWYGAASAVVCDNDGWLANLQQFGQCGSPIDCLEIIEVE